MDCLRGMPMIDDHSVDMILSDLPYGITGCRWDTVIPFDKLWSQYNRLIKPDGAIVLTASQPFTTELIYSNKRMFRYTWVWEKDQGVNFLNAKKQPLKVHEDVCVFYKHLPVYNPQMTVGKPYISSGKGTSGEVTGKVPKIKKLNNGTRYPRSIIRFNKERGLHPTQKPVKLFEYLIKTYTNPGDLVLDSCIGSGTTAIAAINTKRNFIGFELDEHYFDVANKRIKERRELECQQV
ncbi:site-specific DNA-methyltransferase [Sporolactobacillus sp. CQH2019]|uniref:site-specific DNA-methyltransferase n=1 Tax=Sporolactobacillus sp. CQH2019 TaxID=3023512 RepID=UPI002368E5F6|nr:site-specific DNA-methyltransferase [Sporolactobacillus sp. CQH2019]MDD9149325.1 site-specific DNA-methyltransferase [Sporolactobacillus sp. CQH2019]